MDPLAGGTPRSKEEQHVRYTTVCEDNEGDMMLVKEGPSKMVKDREITSSVCITQKLDFMESVGCEDSNNTDVPQIGMIFETGTHTYDFYNEYGRKLGFSIRKSQQRSRASGVIQMKRHVCSKEGFSKELDLVAKRKRKREVERTGCKARMDIKLREDGKYYVDVFEPQHNHLLTSPRKVHLLRSQRNVTEVQAAEANNLDRVGIRPQNAYTYMQRMADGRQSLGYLATDYRNHLHCKIKKAFEKGVAGSLLEHFALMQVKDPGVFYAFQVDENDLLTNVFWADSRMRGDYEAFGDVVCFDTTFATNNECRPFAPFVGINHHMKTIIFGACLLYDETAESFIWVFNTFVMAMSRKQPKTILTDQDKAMAKAIASTFPSTIHRICVWHMY